MNKTMSKARELLINSRMMRKNENQENKTEISANSNEKETKIEEQDYSKIKLTVNINHNNENTGISSDFNNILNKYNNNAGNLRKLTNENNPNDTNCNKIDENQGFKAKLTDRLALFDNKKTGNLIKSEKPEQPQMMQKPIGNKPNLLDRFNKNVHKEPVVIRQMPMFKLEKEIPHSINLEKENQPVVKEENENQVEVKDDHDQEIQKEVTEETHDIIPEIKYTPHEQEKLMKRMISAKGVNKGLTKAKELGKPKASEKIMGLANMLQNRIGPKQTDDPPLKKIFLLTNDADIQLYNDDNKLVNLENQISEEANKINQTEENSKKPETKDLVDIMLEKPMYKAKIVKKRTQVMFKL